MEEEDDGDDDFFTCLKLELEEKCVGDGVFSGDCVNSIEESGLIALITEGRMTVPEVPIELEEEEEDTRE